MNVTDPMAYVRIIARWWWVTAILVLTTVGVILYAANNTPLVYQSIVKLEVSAPEPEEVGLYTAVRAGATRDEIAAVQSNFSQLVRSTVLAGRTMEALGLRGNPKDLADRINTEIPPFSDFVYVKVDADNPQDAQSIAAAHVDLALKYFGEARSKTTVVRRQFINQQLQAAANDLTKARDALLRFQIKNGTSDLSRDIQSYQDTLRALRLDRDRSLIEIERLNASTAFYVSSAQKATTDGDTTTAGGYRISSTNNQAAVEGLKASVTRMNEVIAQRENELLALVALTTEYSNLQAGVREAESNVNFLQGKVTEAEIKENDAQSVSFIQVIEPAQKPGGPVPVRTRSALLPGIFASLVGGVILAFGLEYVSLLARRRRPPQEGLRPSAL